MRKLWYVYPHNGTVPVYPDGFETQVEGQLLAAMVFDDPRQADVRHEYEHPAQQVAA